ncbi:hypothetical protein ACFP7A_04275 [Sporolactobacillus kofuensis]|uniref:Uncharacterized protein n=1 Tax=Sporolactobacillus kofuensis TaxID=269672 RepID=A0ABW1WCA4_9BACL
MNGTKEHDYNDLLKPYGVSRHDRETLFVCAKRFSRDHVLKDLTG